MVSTSCVTFSNPDVISLQLSNRIWSGMSKNLKKKYRHSFERAGCQEAIGSIYYTKKWRAKILRPGLKIDNFKPRVKKCIGIFKCISWLNSLFFGRWSLGFFEGGNQDLSNITNVASYLANFFPVLSSIVCDSVSVRQERHANGFAVTGKIDRRAPREPPHRRLLSRLDENHMCSVSADRLGALHCSQASLVLLHQ